MEVLPKDVEIFAETKCVVGEGPLWIADEECFYWIDLRQGNIYRKKDNSNASDFEVFKLDVGYIGGIVRCQSKKFLLFCEYGFVYEWVAGDVPTKIAKLSVANDSRFNDVFPSVDGGVFCTVAPTKTKKGQLWYFSVNREFSVIENALNGMPNGMGISPDGKTFYLTVSDERIIYKYSYENSKITNRSVFVKIPDTEGLPDGMAVDAHGNVWSAQWNGYRLVKYSPKGDKISEIKFPIAKVSSLAFGGRSLDKIIITSANTPWSDDDFKNYQSGKTFIMQSNQVGLNRPLANF